MKYAAITIGMLTVAVAAQPFGKSARAVPTTGTTILNFFSDEWAQDDLRGVLYTGGECAATDLSINAQSVSMPLEFRNSGKCFVYSEENSSCDDAQAKVELGGSFNIAWQLKNLGLGGSKMHYKCVLS
ncbi:hypothetical protein BDV96DRAFT_651994 [Lophiotrema nucula]|uniref:AA1-like domain-containing protein n=1 Tax=Lophiotrema nucula TaxID=690887 RepID=A0A6A5YR16_9PLEO|nr:hypothetical protein BDV96DRAFT_651994 [Lophiotrema nucula]